MEGLANYLLKSAGLGDNILKATQGMPKAVDALKGTPKSPGFASGRAATFKAGTPFKHSTPMTNNHPDYSNPIKAKG